VFAAGPDSVQDVAAILDGDFGITIRTGLHCAPLALEAMRAIAETCGV